MPTPIPEDDLAEALGFPRHVLEAHRKGLTQGEHFARKSGRIVWTAVGMTALQGLIPDLAKKIGELADSPSLPAGDVPPPAPVQPQPSPSEASTVELVSAGHTLNPHRLHCHKKNGGAPCLLRTHRPDLFPAGFTIPCNPTETPDLFDPLRLPNYPGRW